MEQTGRKQFTCYRSYYEAIRKIKKAADRAKAYDILMEYALDGAAPEEDGLPVSVSIAFLLIKPNLDAAWQKAMGGKRGGALSKKKGKTDQDGQSILQGYGKDAASKKEKETEIEKESFDPLTPFERFWQAYPRKEGRREAERVFAGVNESVDILLKAIEEQRQRPSWQKENGRYIPGPARWLAERRWQDALPSMQENTPGEAELRAIRRIMTDPDYFAPR